MRISDWSSDVCSSDLRCERSRRIDCFNPLMALELSDYGICLDIPTSCRQPARRFRHHARHHQEKQTTGTGYDEHYAPSLGWQEQIHCRGRREETGLRSEENTSELTSLKRLSYDGF